MGEPGGEIAVASPELGLGASRLIDGMIDEMEQIDQQAAQLEAMLPVLMARLFRLDPDHPLAEMPLAQLRICVFLQSGPRPMSAISEEFKTSVSAVTQMADRLERGDLVERITDCDDRRQKMLALTEFGARVMRTRREMRVNRVHEALKQLSPEIREMLITAIGEFREAAKRVNDTPEDESVYRGFVVPQP